MSSIGSSTSTIVSFRGDDEVDLDEALRILYQELQQNLNYSQCAIRQLAIAGEQDDDFLETAKIYFELDDYVDILLNLFTELKAVSKQCLGKPPPEHKEQYAKMILERKEKKKQAKNQAKEAEKKMTPMDIIQE